MSTGSVTTGSIYNELQQYFQTRGSDQQALGKALQSGNLATAQQEYNAIQTLAQTGPFAGGNAYLKTNRETDFTAVGQALQAGDLAGAQKAFTELQSTFKKPPAAQQTEQTEESPAVVVNIGGPSSTASTSSAASSAAATTGSTAPGSGSEIVVNLGAATPGEQITIGVSNAANGGEQLTIGVANQAGQTPQQITLNLAQTANQEIILNLFNSTAASTTAGSGVSLSA
jgi:hypothetical protein